MGLLLEPVYDAISEKSYGEGREYTGARYLDSGFHFREDLAVRTYFAPGGRVMVAAASGGRELIALVRAGYRAAGFECSHAMVTAGKRALAERGIAATLDWAPPCVAPPMEGPFDALIVGWNGYCYIRRAPGVSRFCKTLGRNCAPDRRFSCRRPFEAPGRGCSGGLRASPTPSASAPFALLCSRPATHSLAGLNYISRVHNWSGN